ncbi:serine/threonine-protein kinase [Actinomadura welshii]|uniref:serine/threonine-protein kinase n=1 Tax=Actinomadura welshii TaxID=3103817 RepID=UPI0003AD56AC|nr:serine/threonine-protein kinase [Actinomadura madurae]
MTLPLLPDDPQLIGRYRLLGRLGQGGQGVVYLAEADDLGRVALKRLIAGTLDELADRRAQVRFKREVVALRQLNEKCTAPILDWDLDADPPYLVSVYVPGRSLHELVAGDGAVRPLRRDELEGLAVRTITALSAVHRKGIMHRDIKPKNILIGRDSRPRIIDFGVAKMLNSDTQSREIFGTPAFMSPEQHRNDRVKTKTDIYSWALTILFAAGGYDPESGKSDVNRVGDPLRGMLEACLAEDQEKRPSAHELHWQMTKAGIARAHGASEEWTAVSAMPSGGTAAGHTRRLLATPWYLRPYLPIPVSVGVTTALTTLAFVLLDAGAEKVLPAAVGLFVVTLMLFSIGTDPAHHSQVRQGRGRPRKPTPPPPG